MKLVCCLFAVVGPLSLVAAETPAEIAFAGLKKLEGTWSGPAENGGQKMVAKVTYRLTGGGSALVETQFPGTAHEMLTVYHLDGQRLILTHYCAAQNQPTMKMTSHQGSSWKFDFVSGTNMKATDMHMHSVAMKLLGADHLTSDWTAYVDGKPAGVAHFDLRRQK